MKLTEHDYALFVGKTGSTPKIVIIGIKKTTKTDLFHGHLAMSLDLSGISRQNGSPMPLRVRFALAKGAYPAQKLMARCFRGINSVTTLGVERKNIENSRYKVPSEFRYCSIFDSSLLK